jgi:hypothetical protein
MPCEAIREKGAMVMVPSPVVGTMGPGGMLVAAARSSSKAGNGARANA